MTMTSAQEMWRERENLWGPARSRCLVLELWQCRWDARPSKRQGPAGTPVEIIQNPSRSTSSPSTSVKVEGMVWSHGTGWEGFPKDVYRGPLLP